MRKIVIGCILLFFLLTPLFAEKSAQQLLDEFAKTLSIPAIQGGFTVKLIAKNGDVREIKARAYQKMIGKNQINRLFVFSFPPRVRGTSLLLHSYYDGRPNNMWIYLPTIKRVKRIALESSGGGYFMGSDFTYRDLINIDKNQMEFELLADKVIGGVDSYTLKSWGKTEKIRQELGYSYYISYYNKKNSVQHRREFFDFNNKLLKVFEVNDFYVSGVYYYPTKISMTNVQTGHKSMIEVTDVKTEDISDSIFTTRNLTGE